MKNDPDRCYDFFCVCISVLEISTNEYGPHNDRLVEKIQNGLNDTHRLSARLNGRSIYDASLKNEQISNIIAQKEPCCNGRDCRGRDGLYATSFWRQWYLLTIRMIRCLSRDRFLSVMRLSVTLCIALVIGGSYRNIGNDAGQVSFNFRFIYTTVLFFMHVPFVTMIFLCKFSPRKFDRNNCFRLIDRTLPCSSY